MTYPDGIMYTLLLMRKTSNALSDKSRQYLILSVCIFSIFVSLMSCGSNRGIPQSLAHKRDFIELLDIARHSETDPAMRFVALEPIISQARNVGENEWLEAFLAHFLESYPSDPYGSYYLMAMAEGARESGSGALRLDYLRRLLKNYPDLEIKGQSMHLISMERIATNSNDLREIVEMRLKMKQHYPDRIDSGLNYYRLAEAYRQVGDWDAMYQAYTEYLNYPATTVPDTPDARERVLSDLSFHNSSKSWTMENLDDLVASVKYAIRHQDAGLLTKLQTKPFFLMNWSQETSDPFTHIPMTLGSFLKPSIRYNRNLESYSNESEAFLKTSGWSWKIRTWILYFRRIDYPADPEINGSWEWAGIYFGDRL